MFSKKDQETLATYNQIALDWQAKRPDKFFWGSEQKKFKKLMPSGKVLDIGCGTGRDSFFFRDNDYEYLGIDGSSAMVKLARKNNPKAKFKIKNFGQISSLPKSFNGFWAAASLLHVPKSQVGKLLKNIKNLIKTGGVGFISLRQGRGEKSEIWPGTRLTRFYVYYQLEEFNKILNSAGFRVLEAYKKSKAQGIWLCYFVKV